MLHASLLRRFRRPNARTRGGRRRRRPRERPELPEAEFGSDLLAVDRDVHIIWDSS